MSALRSIPKSHWPSFFDRLSQALRGKWTEVEVASLDLGDMVMAEWIPMMGITYESRDDLLDIALDRMNHLIRRPMEVVVEEDASGVKSVAVLDAEGTRQIINFKTPLALPAPVSP